MKLIVGLGNPGQKYAGTRHNVGFDVVDVLAARWQIGFDVEKFHAHFAMGEVVAERVILLKPTTLMNRSGRAVLAAGRFYKLELQDLLVVADDMALPLGRLRMRSGGSAGSHKGLQSVIDRMGTPQWCRLRVGLGDPLGDPASWVLGKFGPEDEAVMEQARQRGADAVQCWIRHGVEQTMNRFNSNVPAE